MLRLRLIFGLLLAGAVVALLVLDAWLATLTPPTWVVPGLGINVAVWLMNGAISTALVAVFVLLAAHELLCFARARGCYPSWVLTQIGAVGLVIGPYVIFNSQAAAARTGEAWGLFLLCVVLGVSFVRQSWRYGTNQVMSNIAATMFIVLYTGGLGHFMCRLRMEVGGKEGVPLLLFSLFVVKMTDVGAYFAGRLFGRHRMIPWLSPMKTWEGLVGGVLVAAASALGVGHLLHVTGAARMGPEGAPYVLSLLGFGLLMAALSVAGDLCASLLKRDAAVKDSGEALPGFGGVLDVLDSPLLAAPVAWAFWTRLVHVGSAIGA
ncbi:MAG: phosphatidate cytidylyltransferase [Phycisphaerae bacterium]